MKPLIRFCVALSVIIAVVVAFWLFTTDSQETTPPANSFNQGGQTVVVAEQGASGGQNAPSKLVGGSSAVTVPETLPASLAGTSVPGGWARTDRLGNLIPTPHLRQMFEYFLSALGEESLHQLVARIESALAALEEPARSQALATLGAYLDYKLAVSELEQAYGDATGLGLDETLRRMSEVHALRRTWLDAATAEAFFADDEAVDRFQMEKRQIARDGSLTAEEKAEALRKAESSLPEPLREAREETRQFAEYEQVRQQLAGDPRALQAWRQEVFGAEAADRLAQLEKEQQEWDQRWQVYSVERNRLMSSGLAAQEREEALDRLRARHFNETERIRAEALDSIR
ncbi:MULTISPECIES: lipase secretion chaperone [Marinobacter]|uniref:Lipase chaperone n=1 Tax=Marinobacter metalliresistant TaxID=2961995 RepID=A0ABZ2VX67_9GAMM|nr:lipase secretion chaperone [Marinobacter sp. Arc7-DN-1]AXS85264.1 lipase [Marinobacter sp. Arc7-DN-1]